MWGVRTEDDPCRIGPDTRDGHQVAEELLLGTRGEAIEQVSILTDHLGDEDLALFLPRQGGIGRQGDSHGIAHAGTLDEHGGGGQFSIGTSEVSNHLDRI